ncbi:MAG: 4-hydroxy-tetrahydrodipicolinate synthase [Chlamydiales bacterium]|nr:4-hydroxy-tetrahydrodipicolinate synthase [Chlamydiia bacterium]MCP5508648.1 4-hydroxy-tetrahydrodipicolinate synthase [Chlamydiales bacterium]
MRKFQGVYTAIITPFTETGEVDIDGLKQNIDYQLKNQIDGIVALGTTGESPTLTPQEKETVIKTTYEACKGKAPLIVGTGTNSTIGTIAASRQAESHGADALLIVTPYYNKPSQQGIYEHFSAIAQAVSIPLIVYNHPHRTGQNISGDTLCKLAEVDNILAVKDASGNLAQMEDVIEKVCRGNPAFSVLSGDDALTLPLMSLGGHGVVSVISNLLPNEMKTLVNAAMHGDYDKAREIHFHLRPLLRALGADSNPIPIKTAMRRCGMPAGSCRLPLVDMEPHHQYQLYEELTKMCNDLMTMGVV